MALKNRLTITAITGILSIHGMTLAAENKPAAPAPAAPAPARNPAPAPTPAPPTPSHAPPVATPQSTYQSRRPANQPQPAPSGPNQNQPPKNDQGRAPGGIQPPANAEEAQQQIQADRQRTAQNNENRRDRQGRWDQRLSQGPFLNNWGPYSWWYNGNSYWWPPYDPDYGAARADETATTPTPTPPTAPTAPPPPLPTQAKAINQLEGLPAYRQAMAELTKAQAAYDAASTKVLEKLKTNPDYQQLIKTRDQAEENVEAVQASAKIPSSEEVTSAAQRKLDIKAKITRMEQDALMADTATAAAKSRLIDANAQVQTYKKQAHTTGGQ